MSRTGGVQNRPRESVNIPKDDSKDASFQVFPSELKESQTHIRAELTSGKKAYGEGYTVVTREDLGTFYYYQPAVQRVEHRRREGSERPQSRLHHGRGR